jgi:hypothetical protein
MPGAHLERCGHAMTHLVSVLVGMLCITPVALSRRLLTAHRSFDVRIFSDVLQPCSENVPFRDTCLGIGIATLARGFVFLRWLSKSVCPKMSNKFYKVF